MPDEKCRSHIYFTLQLETGLINALVFCIQWIILMLWSPAIIRQRRPLVNISRDLILHKWIQSPLQICITITHHSSIKALQSLLKLIMVSISSLLSSKSKTCMDKNTCWAFMKTDWVILVYLVYLCNRFNSKGNTSKFSLILLGFTDLGMTTTFLCMWKRIRTWKERSLLSMSYNEGICKNV